MNKYFENGTTENNDSSQLFLAQWDEARAAHAPVSGVCPVSEQGAAERSAERNKTDVSALRRWVAFAAGALCAGMLAVLLLVYALVPLPEWVSLVMGVTIVLAFASTMTAIGIGAAMPSGWE